MEFNLKSNGHKSRDFRLLCPLHWLEKFTCTTTVPGMVAFYPGYPHIFRSHPTNQGEQTVVKNLDYQDTL